MLHLERSDARSPTVRGLLIALRIAERLVGLASFSILARFLAPSDFGLLALATSVIAVVELFGQAGINLALIQRRSASRAEYDTAWTIDVLVGAVVAGIVAASAASLAVLLNEPRVERILYWLAAASASVVSRTSASSTSSGRSSSARSSGCGFRRAR